MLSFRELPKLCLERSPGLAGAFRSSPELPDMDLELREAPQILSGTHQNVQSLREFPRIDLGLPGTPRSHRRALPRAAPRASTRLPNSRASRGSPKPVGSFQRSPKPTWKLPELAPKIPGAGAGSRRFWCLSGILMEILGAPLRRISGAPHALLSRTFSRTFHNNECYNCAGGLGGAT